jgi:hypothetical protein
MPGGRPPIYKLGVIVEVVVKGGCVTHGSFSNCMSCKKKREFNRAKNMMFAHSYLY